MFYFQGTYSPADAPAHRPEYVSQIVLVFSTTREGYNLGKQDNACSLRTRDRRELHELPASGRAALLQSSACIRAEIIVDYFPGQLSEGRHVVRGRAVAARRFYSVQRQGEAVHKIKTPRGDCPSTNNMAPFG